ncbi:MAG: protein adenylyltransferase SelO [Paracoccaceae bacterium]
MSSVPNQVAKTAPIPFDNTYARLPARFFTRQNPVAVAQASLVAMNEPLARELGIDLAWLAGPDGVMALAGNLVPERADPLAQVYAGHQFGGWVPQLGDGRAILLGEVVDSAGQRRDIQLKGSGRTPYSRGGDGRAWLGPVLREYVVSEAMHALGVPTTRALAAVSTGQVVQRETALPGAILTRVAASHIRVGTFQYFAARQDTQALKLLCDYVIDRHYPDAEGPLDLLNAVIGRQASLIAKWMSVGFIHGVMNTDNMAISGETIDYGPCAFMDVYHPDTVFSSIDQFGRYAYAHQPEIAVWNLAQFATCLLPLMGEREAAVEAATDAVHQFPPLYSQEWLALFGRKIGLNRAQEGDRALIEAFLDGLAQYGADFTNGFRDLLQNQVPEAMADWKSDWQARLQRENGDVNTIMRAANPAYTPRNHRIETMIQAAVAGEFALFEKLMNILAHPYEDQPDALDYRQPPAPDEVVQQTFCGT